MIIGFAGKMQVGKDLSAKIVQELVPNTWKIVKFADKLKDVVCLLIGCTREQLEDPEFKEQELGEEWWYWEDQNTKKTYVYDDHRPLFSGRPEYPESMKIIKPTPRFLLQYIGTDLFRHQLHVDTWVNATMANYKPQKMSEYNPSQWIISDVRFPNEARAIKERGGILIQIVRDSAPISDHISETALDGYDNFHYIVKNNGTIGDLKDQIENILKIEDFL